MITKGKAQSEACDRSSASAPKGNKWSTDSATSGRMRKVRRTDTNAEVRLRRVLYSLGLRYRLHCRHLPGSPDIVFPRHKTAIFVHGCFWHRHLGCRRATMPRRNIGAWEKKFKDNVQRDSRKESELTAAGWKVLIVWECEILQDPVHAAHAVLQELSAARG